MAVREAPDPTTLSRLARQASIIFTGTVRATRASNAPSVPAATNTAVVRVTEVFEPLHALQDLAGTEVTVRLRSTKTLRSGDRALFFANGLSYGESVAMEEVGRMPSAAARAIRRGLATTRLADADAALRAHLDGADAVVVGVVTATRPRRDDGTPPPSEHDPEWWTATLKVTAVRRGTVDPNGVLVAFANSRDDVWLDAAKPRPGDRGIWLLHHDKRVEEEFAVLHAEDFHLLHELPRLESLLVD